MTSRGGTAAARSIRLLGTPSVQVAVSGEQAPRGSKAWGLLAYLVLSSAPVPRSRLAALLFPDADDPLAALRWNLSQVRSALQAPDALRGDPLTLRPEESGDVDVVTLLSGAPAGDDLLDRLGLELLEGIEVPTAPAFGLWLDMQRRHVQGASESLLHETALAQLARGDARAAGSTASRLVALNPYDEDFQALLVRCLAASGDGVGAARQVAACRELFRRELGVEPGPALDAAARTVTRTPTGAPSGGTAAVRALVDAGNAAVGAGAVDAGLECLRRAVAEAGALDDALLRSRALCDLGSALVHAVRGRDEEGATALHQAVAGPGDPAVVVDACRELGFVEFMRGRYDRVDGWLRQAEAAASEDGPHRARLLNVRGASRSDVGRYAEALADLALADRWAGRDRDRSYALSMTGRAHLLRGELEAAEEALTTSVALARSTGWTGFLPWPESLLGEVELATGRGASAQDRLEEAFALGCQIGDPCWEGVSAHGLGLAAAARGRTDEAIDVLLDARARSTRLPDGYAWLDSRILDSLCRLGAETGDARAAGWAEELANDASRRGMRELVVRARLHQAGLGQHVDAADIQTLAADIDNPALHRLVAQSLP